MSDVKLKLLIGGSSSKIFHLKEFVKALEKLNVECKLVFDGDYADGFPSRKLATWFTTNSKFNDLVSNFKPDVIFVDRQRHFGLKALKKEIPLIVHLRGNHWEEIKMARETLYKSLPKKLVLQKWEEIAEKCFDGSKMILPICNFLSDIVAKRYPGKPVETLSSFLNEVEKTNQKQITNIIYLIEKKIGSINKKRITVLGTSFKPETDDIRDSMSIKLIKKLLEKGAKVTVHDPKAIENTKKMFSDKIEYGKSIIESLTKSQCVIIMTKWKEYSKITNNTIRKMDKRIIIDSRRILAEKNIDADYEAIGIGNSK